VSSRVAWGAIGLIAGLALLGARERVGRVGLQSEALRPGTDGLPAEGLREAYATSSSCRACHPDDHASWYGTYHRTMTQVARPLAVQGVFDGRALDEAGLNRVGRHGDRFWAEMSNADGSTTRRNVVLVTGSHHMQVYWVASESGDRLVAFPWAWLNEEQAWVPNEATLLRPPDVEVEYTWNRVCIKCHVVAGSPGWDEATESVATAVAELGIACEACHGPGRAHVERHRNPLERYARHLGGDPPDDVVHPERLTSAESSELCGQCHAITFFHDDAAWVRAGHDHPPPAPMSAWGRLVRHPLRADQPWIDEVLDDNPDFFAERFWSDGMVRVSGREYNGLVESACHQRGELSCITCHSMHDAPPDDQLRPEATTDVACASCHRRVAADLQAHTRHPPGPSHPSCQDCHMPHTTYGLLKAMRSHEIDSPSVQVTMDTGRPNACNLCHLDRTLGWTAEHLSAWYGQARPDPWPDDESRESAALRWLLTGDAGQRALLAWHFGWAPAHAASGGGWQAPSLGLLQGDPYAAVRLVAARSLRRLAELDARQGPGARRPDPRRVLLRPDGSWDAQAARDLFATRDERAVSLAE
jgi:hypothetical protein